jgi:hypothetical protein
MGYNCAGLTECAKILSGVKAETSCVAERADLSSFVFGSMSLAGILDNKQTDRAHARLPK